MSYLIRKAKPTRLIQPGEWQQLHATGPTFICCPACGAMAMLTDTHAIAMDGVIAKPVQCVTCGFHSVFKLENWDES